MSIDTGRARFLVDKLNLSQALVQRQQGRQLLSASFLRWESFFEVFRKTSGLPTDVKIDFLAKWHKIGIFRRLVKTVLNFGMKIMNQELC